MKMGYPLKGTKAPVLCPHSHEQRGGAAAAQHHALPFFLISGMPLVPPRGAGEEREGSARGDSSSLLCSLFKPVGALDHMWRGALQYGFEDGQRQLSYGAGPRWPLSQCIMGHLQG